MSDQIPCTKNCKKGNSICLPCVIPKPDNTMIDNQKNLKNAGAPDCTCAVKYCKRAEAPHPCDKHHCDPNEEVEGECPAPYICKERIKNPALPTENTRCLPGAFMNVKTCFRPDPDHPCDPPVPCSLKGKSRNCQDPVLCHHRIKNPEIPKRPITTDCDPTK